MGMADQEKLDEILVRLKRLEPSRRMRRLERTILAVLATWIGYREMNPPTPDAATHMTTAHVSTSTSGTSTLAR